MSHALLPFFQRNHVVHHRYLFMEVSHVDGLVVYQFIKTTQLQSCKLTRQQIEQHRGIEFDVLTNENQCLADNLVVVESQILYLRQSYPTGLIVVQILTESTVYLHYRQISNGHDAIYLRLDGSLQPVNVFRVFRAILGTESLKLRRFTDFSPVNSFSTRLAASSKSSS